MRTWRNRGIYGGGLNVTAFDITKEMIYEGKKRFGDIENLSLRFGDIRNFRLDIQVVGLVEERNPTLNALIS